MVIYLLILAVTLVAGLDAQKVNSSKVNKKQYIAIVFGMMIVFAVFRGYNVGIDYANRVEHMELLFVRDFPTMIRFTHETMEWQYLYTVPIWLLSHIIPSPWFYNALMDIFVLGTFGWFFYRYSRDVTLSSMMFVVFVYAAELNITRQYIAAALFLIALHQLLHKMHWRALITLIAASFIHSSAVLMFAVYLMYYFGFHLTKGRLTFYLSGAVVLYLLFDVVIKVFLAVFPQYSYALREKFIGTSGFSIKWLIIYLTIFTGIWLVTPRRRKLSGYSNRKMLRVSITGIIGLGFILYATLAMLRAKMWFVQRMMVYFIFGFCMIIPEIISLMKSRYRGRTAMEILLTTMGQYCLRLERVPTLQAVAKQLRKLIIQIKNSPTACRFSDFVTGVFSNHRFLPAVELFMKICLVIWGCIQYALDPHGLLPYTFIWQ